MKTRTTRHMSTAWSSGRGEGNNRTKARTVSKLHGQALQLSGQIQRLASWRSRFKEGDGHCQRPYPWEAQLQLGSTLQNHVVAEERHLPPRDTWRTKVTPSMERRAPTKVLLVGMMAWGVTLIIFQFALVNFIYNPQFFQFTLVKICYNTS